MAKLESNFDIYFVVRNSNIKRQESKITAIMKKLNSAGGKLISTIIAVVHTKNQLSTLSILGKENVITTLDI